MGGLSTPTVAKKFPSAEYLPTGAWIGSDVRGVRGQVLQTAPFASLDAVSFAKVTVASCVPALVHSVPVGMTAPIFRILGYLG